MRRATRLDLLVIDDLSAISIHALHEESDRRTVRAASRP